MKMEIYKSFGIPPNRLQQSPRCLLKMTGIVVAALIGVSAASSVARAEQLTDNQSPNKQGGQNWGGNPQWMEFREACHADYQRFCAETQPGGGRTLTCFKQNVSKLSLECRKAILASDSAK
jgi:hypothetical protein